MPSSPDIALSLLAPPALHLGQRTLQGQTAPRIFCLLAYLAVEGPSSKARIAALFWPQVQDVPARRNLRQLLHRLRSMLGDAAGQVQMQTDYLQLADDCQTDMQRFLRPVEGTDLQDRETQLALYRGDFLQDLTLDDNSPELSAWVATVRQRCRERAVTLALALAAAYVQRDQQELALRTARRALDFDPGNRAALHLTMLQYSRCGQPQQALALYHEWERRLVGDAALPAHETLLLYRHISRTVAEAHAQPKDQLDSRLLSVLALSWPALVSDHEDMAEALDHLHERCATVLAGFGAHLVPIPQGGLLAYFGYPSSMAQSLWTALLAAADLQRQIPEASEMLLALHTGNAMCHARRPDVNGSLTRTVLTLSAVADNGSLLASSACFAALGQPNWLVPLASADAMAPRHYLMQWPGWCNRVALSAHPLAGREAELQELCQRWQDAQRGKPVLVQIGGAAGIGKSHLMRAFLDQTGAARILQAQCDPFAIDSPLQPVLEMFEAAAKAADGNPVRLALQRHVPLPSGAATWLHAALPGNTAPQVRPVTMEALEQVIAGLSKATAELAQAQPLIIVMEDVHWADPSTLAFLNRLAEPGREASAAPLLVLASSRAQSAIWEAGASRIGLMPLDADAGHMLLHALNSELDSAAAAQLLEAGGGHPLFLSELARHADDNGKGLPSTIRELVQIRLDELGPARKTACLAAVIGIGFKRSWLEAVALAQGTDATQLEALLQTDLLQQEGGNLKFSHALLRDAVITLLPARQFRELARTVAQTLTTQFAAGFEQEPERAAHWFTEAEDWPAAMLWRRKAASLAMRYFAYPEALRHLQAGLALLPQIGLQTQRDAWEREWRDVCHEAIVMVHGLYSSEVAHHYQRKSLLAELHGQAATDIDTMRGMLVEAENKRGQRAVLQLLRRLLQQPQVRLGDGGVLIRLQEIRINALMLSGAVRQASDLCGQQLRLSWPPQSAKPAHDPMLAMAARDIYLAWLRGDWEQHPERQSQVLEAARQSPQPGTRVFALGFVIMAGLGARLPQQIAPLIAEFQVVVDKMGLAIFKTIGDGFDACRRVLSGDHSGTAAMLGVINDAATHLVFYRPFFLLYLALSLCEQGDHDEALAALDMGEASMRSHGSLICRADYLILRARLTAGQPQQAAQLLQKAYRIALRQGAQALALRALLALARLRPQDVDIRNRLVALLAHLPAAPHLPELNAAQLLLAEGEPCEQAT